MAKVRGPSVRVPARGGFWHFICKSPTNQPPTSKRSAPCLHCRHMVPMDRKRRETSLRTAPRIGMSRYPSKVGASGCGMSRGIMDLACSARRSPWPLRRQEGCYPGRRTLVLRPHMVATLFGRCWEFFLLPIKHSPSRRSWARYGGWLSYKE